MAATWLSQRRAKSTNGAVQGDSDEGVQKWWGKTQGLRKVLIYWSPQLLWVLKNKQRRWQK
eukprot:10082154-Ditylum_brightwellii.AAC.1